MPRTARASVGNVCYHGLKRDNGRAEAFHKEAREVPEPHAFVSTAIAVLATTMRRANSIRDCGNRSA